MLNISEKSMTHGKLNKKKVKLYSYLKEFNKNMNFLFYEVIKIDKLL